MNCASVRPIFSPLHKPFSHWILLKIKPLREMLFSVSKAVVPAARLKTPIGYCHAVSGNRASNRLSTLQWKTKNHAVRKTHEDDPALTNSRQLARLSPPAMSPEKNGQQQDSPAMALVLQ
jgi:hypothetical protein